jgi:hypothetical protein
MRRPVMTLSQLVLTLGLSHAMGAQGPPLMLGDRIRLTVPTAGSNPVVGIVERMPPDTILVRTSVDVLSAVPLDQLTRLELSRGTRRPTWSLAAPLWMTMAGGGVGWILGYTKPASRESPEDAGSLIGIVGGVIGLVAGVATAIVVDEREKWESVPTRSGSRTSLAPSLYVAPAARGLTVGLRATF